MIWRTHLLWQIWSANVDDLRNLLLGQPFANLVGYPQPATCVGKEVLHDPLDRLVRWVVVREEVEVFENFLLDVISRVKLDEAILDRVVPQAEPRTATQALPRSSVRNARRRSADGGCAQATVRRARRRAVAVPAPRRPRRRHGAGGPQQTRPSDLLPCLRASARRRVSPGRRPCAPSPRPSWPMSLPRCRVVPKHSSPGQPRAAHGRRSRGRPHGAPIRTSAAGQRQCHRPRRRSRSESRAPLDHHAAHLHGARVPLVDRRTASLLARRTALAGKVPG
jgi:hypothetical protein